MLKDILGDYIPDFTYQVVRIHDYSNEELLERRDEMSLLMMINKVQTAEDMSRFLQSEPDKIAYIISKAPAPVLDVIASTIWSLCIKINMPVDEAKECVKKVKDRDMGYLFENMEKMDIQAERRMRQEAEQKLENAIKSFIQLCQEFHMEKSEVTLRLIEKYDLNQAAAEDKVRKYWA